MILGSPTSISSLLGKMQELSTRVHDLNSNIIGFLRVINDYTDNQLEDIFTAGGSATASADVLALRAWQSSLQNYSDNFTGNGTLSDNSFEICKRVILVL